jgi:SpoIIAA-like
MVERIDEMPPGTVGFRATGKLTRDDYREQFVPAMKEAIETGDMRMLYVLGPGFDGMKPGALVEDTKASFESLRHHSAWHRTAIATDVDWIRNGIHLFGWMVPGEMRLYGLDQLEDAKRWLAG